MRRYVGYWLLVVFFCFGPAYAASLRSSEVSLGSQLEAIFSDPQQPIFASICSATARDVGALRKPR